MRLQNRARLRTMNANPQTLDEALEELELEAEEMDPLPELDFRLTTTVNWDILEDMGWDYE
jgi:hypothetical protein